MSDKRIIDLEAKQTLGSGDYLAADSAQGTYKVDANTNIMTPLTNVRNNVANSSASPDKYSSSTAYKVGDMVIHDDILYICTTACSAASWAVNSACFTATTLSSAITQLNSDLTSLISIGARAVLNDEKTIDISNYIRKEYFVIVYLNYGNQFCFTLPNQNTKGMVDTKGYDGNSMSIKYTVVKDTSITFEKSTFNGGPTTYTATVYC